VLVQALAIYQGLKPPLRESRFDAEPVSQYHRANRGTTVKPLSKSVNGHFQSQKSEILTILASIIIVVSDEANDIGSYIRAIAEIATCLLSDYEIVIIDNGSTDGSQEVLRHLTSQSGEPNLQVYTLEGRVNDLTARWVGIENSLGDVVVCIEPRYGDIDHLERLIRSAAGNLDLVFTRRVFRKNKRSLPRRALYRSFGALAQISTGIDLNSYSTSLIALSRRVVSYLLQFPDPQIHFRNLPSSTGFRRTCIDIPLSRTKARDIQLRESINRGIRLVTAYSDSPLRIATALSAFGALASFLYSIYVLMIWIYNEAVTPGWVSLSMQQSGMFFLISLVLLVLSEYVLEISRKAHSGPSYYIAQELTSAKLTRKERLNIEHDEL
jgi:glycosyltransferase involved in cell wall biosynthesis